MTKKKKFTSYILTIFLLLAQVPLFSADNVSPSPSLITSTYEPKEECYHVFHKGIFDSYLDQLNGFLQQELLQTDLEQKLSLSESKFAPKMLEFIDLCKINPSTPEGKRIYHESMILHLRKLIDNKKTMLKESDIAIIESVQFIDKLCLWMYTKPVLMNHYANFLKSTVPLNKFDTALAKTEFIELIGKVHSSVKDNKEFCGYYTFKMRTDDHHAGYVPSLLFEAFETPFIATPRVMMRDAKNGVIPEFKNYLAAMQARQQKHLYINLMHRVGSERPYCLNIEKLSERKTYSNTLYVCTLDKSSDFYLQRNNYENCDDAAEFKNIFLKEMFADDEVNSFRWPHQFDRSLWEAKCSQMINEVHANYFGSSAELSLMDRHNFIEIVYLKIVKELCNIISPDNANISCKSTIDRGPSLLCMVLAYDYLQKKHTLSQEIKTKFITILFAPPLFSHNRPSHDIRIGIAQSALAFLLKKGARG